MALRWMGLLTDRYYRPHGVPRAQFLRSLRDGTVCVELWVQLCIQCSMERLPRLNSFNWNKTLYWPCVRFHIFVFTASLSYWRLGFTSCYARRIVLTASEKYLAAITRKKGTGRNIFKMSHTCARGTQRRTSCRRTQDVRSNMLNYMIILPVI